MTKQTQDVEQVEREEVTETEDGVGVVEAEVSSVSADGLQNTLDSMAESFDVTGFKCAQCGLTHGHSTNKHRASDSFDVSQEEAAEMEFNPACHCGYNAIAAGAEDVDVADAPSLESASSTAPIPDHTMQELKGR